MELIFARYPIPIRCTWEDKIRLFAKLHFSLRLAASGGCSTRPKHREVQFLTHPINVNYTTLLQRRFLSCVNSLLIVARNDYHKVNLVGGIVLTLAIILPTICSNWVFLLIRADWLTRGECDATILHIDIEWGSYIN